MPPQPPRAAVRLLERWLPAADRDELIGDLHEEFRERRALRGPSRAAAWVWAQTILLLVARRRLVVDPVIEDAIDSPPRRGPWADARADWRLAWRTLRRSPAFAAVALASMTLSLGLATAVFSIVSTVLLRPVTVPTADRLVRLGTFTPGADSGRQARVTAIGAQPPSPSLRDVVVGAWLARRSTLTAIATYEASSQTITIENERVRAGLAMVGAGFFGAFPVQPLAGRTLADHDTARTAPYVAVVSERLMRQRHADPAAVIGRTVTIYERPYEIAGVLPSAYDWPAPSTEVWIADRTVWPTPDMTRNFSRSTLAVGFMRPDVTPTEVQREGQQIADEIHALSPDPRATGTPRMIVKLLSDELLEPIWPALMLLVFGTVAVVVAANVNLAGFLMARGTARRRDLAVRRALGATRWRIVRPLLFEQFLLSWTGALGALVLAYWVLRVLPTVAPHDLPRLADVALDRSALVFTCATAMLTALVVSLAPAVRVPRASLREMAAEGGVSVAGTSRAAELTRSALVTTQIAVATLLLVGGVLVGRSLVNMLRIDTGYDPRGVLTFQLGLTADRSQPGRIWHFFETLQARLSAEPGVVNVGLSDALPLHGDTIRSTFTLAGLTPPTPPGAPAPSAHTESVSATYLQTLGARLTRGRFFTAEDVTGAEPVAMVNEAFVRTFMPSANPLDQIVPRGIRRFRIVGVIEPVKRAVSVAAEDPALYTLLTPQHETLMALFSAMGVAVRTNGDPAALVTPLRDIVRELAPGTPVHNVMPLEVRVNRTFAQPRFFAIGLALFAALALVTALVGVYGALAAAVERRRTELGVRRALGATTADVVRLVMQRAFALAGAGLAVGGAVAAAAAVIGRSTLYGVAPYDFASYVVTAALVFVTVAAGALIPARQAVRIDPARVLRSE